MEIFNNPLVSILNNNSINKLPFGKLGGILTIEYAPINVFSEHNLESPSYISTSILRCASLDVVKICLNSPQTAYRIDYIDIYQQPFLKK